MLQNDNKPAAPVEQGEWVSKTTKSVFYMALFNIALTGINEGMMWMLARAAEDGKGDQNDPAGYGGTVAPYTMTLVALSGYFIMLGALAGGAFGARKTAVAAADQKGVETANKRLSGLATAGMVLFVPVSLTGYAVMHNLYRLFPDERIKQYSQERALGMAGSYLMQMGRLWFMAGEHFGVAMCLAILQAGATLLLFSSISMDVMPWLGNLFLGTLGMKESPILEQAAAAENAGAYLVGGAYILLFYCHPLFARIQFMPRAQAGEACFAGCAAAFGEVKKALKDLVPGGAFIKVNLISELGLITWFEKIWMMVKLALRDNAAAAFGVVTNFCFWEVVTSAVAMSDSIRGRIAAAHGEAEQALRYAVHETDSERRAAYFQQFKRHHKAMGKIERDHLVKGSLIQGTNVALVFAFGQWLCAQGLDNTDPAFNAKLVLAVEALKIRSSAIIPNTWRDVFLARNQMTGHERIPTLVSILTLWPPMVALYTLYKTHAREADPIEAEWTYFFCMAFGALVSFAYNRAYYTETETVKSICKAQDWDLPPEYGGDTDIQGQGATQTPASCGQRALYYASCGFLGSKKGYHRVGDEPASVQMDDANNVWTTPKLTSTV